MVRTPEVDRIVQVARALEELSEFVLFVGGATVGLLLTSPRSPRPRATEDVDIVAFVTNYAELAGFHEKLRRRGFAEAEESRVICRWKYQGIVVDVMPPDAAILGFANDLYPSAVQHPLVTIVDEIAVRHIDAPHFLGTKFLAFKDRGQGQIFSSHDLEDIFAVVSSRPEIVAEMSDAPKSCRNIVLNGLRELSNRNGFETAVEGHLANDLPAQLSIVLRRIGQILGDT